MTKVFTFTCVADYQGEQVFIPTDDVRWRP